jgi:hypothetical protein
MRCEPVDVPLGPSAFGPACIACGCTELNACPGPCHWVSLDPPLCSGCGSAVGDPPDAGPFNAQRCAASPAPALHVLLWVDEARGYCARCGEGFCT